MPLTQEQFQKARDAGFTTEQIIGFEKQKQADSKQSDIKGDKQTLDQQIASRPSAINDLVKNPTTMQHPLGALLRTVGGASELYQSVPASIALDLQAGKPQDILPNLVKVATGERPAQYGDVFRGAGVPEPLAAAGGLYSDVALAPGGAEGMKAAGGLANNLTNKGISALKPLLKWKSASEQAKIAKDSVDALERSFGTFVDTSIKDVAGEATNIAIPKNIYHHVSKAISEPVYGIEKNADGSIVQTVGNWNKVKQAISEYSKTGDFQKESTKEVGVKLKQFYGEINQGMKEASKKAGKDISPALDAYSNFASKADYIRKYLVDEQGNAESNLLKSAFKLGTKDNVHQAWKSLSEYSPELKEVMGSMSRREILKSLLSTRNLTKGALLTGAIEGTKKAVTGHF